MVPTCLDNAPILPWRDALTALEEAAGENVLVTSQTENLETDFENKLFFDVLGSSEELLLGEIFTEFWKENEKITKLDFFMTVTDYVKNNAKHFKIATLALALSQELPAEMAIGVLRFYRAYCEADKKSCLILVVEEANQLLKAESLDECKAALAIATEMIEGSLEDPLRAAAAVTATIAAQFYEVAFQFHLKTQQYEAAYREARLFVQYIDLNDVPIPGRIMVCNALMTCCLCSENIFDYGDILAQPVMQWLGMTKPTDSPEYQKAMALKTLMECFNAADAKAFPAAKAAAIQACPEHTSEREAALDLKMKLMVLLDIAFRKPRGHQVVSFQEIMDATLISSELDVHRLLIKALGKGLISGRVDSVQKEVTVTRSQPQAITPDRAAEMALKYHSLIGRASDLQAFMTDLAGETLLNVDTL